MDSTTTSDSSYLIDLGLVHYKEAWDLQKDLHARRVSGEIPDTLLLLEHFPVITQGKSGRAENLLISENLLKARGIEFYKIERGGDVTFHGPGQLVGYPIFFLKERLAGLRSFVERIEMALIGALDDFGIKAGLKPKNIGVWINDKKIASIGIAVKRWVTFHGFALNVNNDLEYFKLIIPCGLKGVEMTSMAQILNRILPMEEIKERVRKNFEKVFNRSFQKSTLDFK
ncbi:MAG: lipoyl(octanoyl) transferase LipB [candidate division WOR-3 bacterium]